MTIEIGSTLPDASLLLLGSDGPTQVQLREKAKGRNVVIFGLPGAFTGTCTSAHLPSFVRTKPQFDAKGVDEVICVSVNDPFVMAAWSESTGAGAAGISMLAEPTGVLAKEMGLDFSAPPAGLLDRFQRFALYAEDGVVKHLNVEDNPGVCNISAGETLLEQI